ncbi:MAG: biopolymer transporter ExbD [bacterium]
MAEMNTSEGHGKKGSKKKKGKKMSTRVDLTPMVDLGFLLVTFFMLTTTFSKPQTMEINMPVKPKGNEVVEDNQNAVKASKALTIILGADNKIFYYSGVPDKENPPEKTDYSAEGIRKVLLEKNRTVKDLVVLIKPTDESNYKNVVDILDEMNISDLKRYALVDIASFDLDLIKDL